MYPEEMCKPMREDLTSVGFIEMKTPEEVENILNKSERTVLVMVNSVCGCAAGNETDVKLASKFSPKRMFFLRYSPRCWKFKLKSERVYESFSSFFSIY